MLRDPSARRAAAMIPAVAEDNARWYPICALADLAPRHVFETELLGVELAIWRSREGEINVWHNCCPHRGMRLTLGANLGGELRCPYHGYRFASGSGRCQELPAHANQIPPASMQVRTLARAEHAGLVWTTLDPVESPAPWLPQGGATSDLYPQHVAAPLSCVGSALTQHIWDLGDPRANVRTRAIDQLVFQASLEPADASIYCFLQPVNAEHTVIHGVLVGRVDTPRLQHLRRAHAASLASLRRCVEARGFT